MQAHSKARNCGRMFIHTGTYFTCVCASACRDLMCGAMSYECQSWYKMKHASVGQRT